MKVAVVNHLKTLRESRGITVMDMASDLHISMSMIYKMEKHPLTPNIEAAYTIAAYLGVQVQQVFEPVYVGKGGVQSHAA